MLNTRGCGILLHPTSLPGPGGIGALGADARSFIDLLHAMGMSYWQVLPLAPPAFGNSPYSAFSAFGGNPLLIDLEQLAREGDLAPASHQDTFSGNRVDFGAVTAEKTALLRKAGEVFLAQPESDRAVEFRMFCNSTPWLHDYARFMALKRRYNGAVWNQWPNGETDAVCDRPTIELAHEIALQEYLQWQFFRQWSALRRYANARGIAIIGDIPIFVAYDSAEVWSHRELFLLDDHGNPTVVAGVPPDYFSATGQLWGNPLYDWDALEKTGYRWWIARFRAARELFDIVRVDHFRGFEAAWQVPAQAQTAREGVWVKGPGERLFDMLHKALGPLPIIAEDLGVITPEVLALRDRYNFPGMKILQFAFDDKLDDRDLPHNHVKHGIVYTGTHDNNTTKGWYGSLSEAERREMHAYLGTSGRDGVGDLIRAALMSVADTAIMPFQDVLHLGSEARMNIPGTAHGNWEWRFSWDMLPCNLALSFRGQLERYSRTAKGGICQ
ncbi:4-alpha-glucanotransferase [Geobacter sp. AOG2]|uniref:4-alpha-glucanotransferase n=1 Tax=Geobacter sp. AOG2 TaxID=1566347 RepID=UPI001CC4904A|nr:4-alpha-glucanotransferase [Geobacter sp. AOG2]GFE60696.1 4-alpha-glucanotransferase [Geobacter sp. AOG2]